MPCDVIHPIWGLSLLHAMVADTAFSIYHASRMLDPSGLIESQSSLACISACAPSLRARVNQGIPPVDLSSSNCRTPLPRRFLSRVNQVIYGPWLILQMADSNGLSLPLATAWSAPTVMAHSP